MTGGERVIVREVKEEDLVTVMRINRICLPENYSYSFFYDILTSYPKSFLIAELDGVAVGYVMCRVERIFSKIERFKLRKAGHIISIAVLPEYRGRGIGRMLLTRAMDVLRDYYGCDEVFLEVRMTNWPAIRLYDKLGLQVVDVLKRYYLDGEDAYVMAKKLR